MNSMVDLRAAAVPLFVVAAIGCGPHTNVTTIRMGGAYLSRGANCSIRFENLDYQEATSKYEQIGIISLTGTSELTDVAKKEVEGEACKIGAHVLTLNASVGSETSGMIQFLALRDPEAQ